MSKVKYIFARFFLLYIRVLAKIELWKVKPYIVGITGSAGKTSVRNAIATVLQSKYTVKRTGAANSETGIPLDILGLHMEDYSMRDWLRVFIKSPIRVITRRKKYEKYVVEMGIDSPRPPKNMGYLLKILRPDTAVFINALPVHSENFDSEVKERIPAERTRLIVRNIANEKGRLINAVNKDGYIVINADDENVMRVSKDCRGKIITVGSKVANVVYTDVHYDLEGFKCKFILNYKGKRDTAHLNIKNQVLFDKYALNFGIAIAVGISQGVDFHDCVAALEKYKVPPGRMSLIEGVKDSYIIDGSYNASAQTVLDALEILENLGNGRRKIAVLGDMRELGQEVQSEHEKVAKRVVQVADEIVLVGPIMKRYVYDKIRKNGFDAEKIHWFKTSYLAKDFIRDNIITGGEVILVKGSQNTIFLERVVEELMKDKSQAGKLLCRRGKYWNSVRSNYEK